MSNDIEQQPTLAEDGKGMAEFMAAKIHRLKGRLEETRSRSHTRAHWQGMIEDCEIILNHLESKTPKAGQDRNPRPGHAAVGSDTVVCERVSP